MSEPPSEALDPRKVGMLAFLVSEAAFFGTLIATFLFFLRPIRSGEPNPRDAFDIPLVLLSTFCLLLSSATIHQAHKSLLRGWRWAFLGWWATTMVLGIIFLGGTALEWSSLIQEKQLTISRNLLGSCYFTLVGFHAAHVSVGVVMLAVVLLLAMRDVVTPQQSLGAELVSWYWHFVDGVWVVVFAVVYVVAR
ncbi:MAG: heme-copper oxidase subunit III [Gemmataceae bacterium]|nr:heme-copper oxidase subunit III [Gemmataceae bacterium]MDW8264953.1 heme-copper oxidase subunit III [Gemmataceae bacterium]